LKRGRKKSSEQTLERVKKKGKIAAAAMATLLPF
jgi:hypothetical protein